MAYDLARVFAIETIARKVMIEIILIRLILNSPATDFKLTESANSKWPLLDRLLEQPLMVTILFSKTKSNPLFNSAKLHLPFPQ
jgi:hypothetical protein